VGLTETEDEMDLQYIKGKGIETEVKTVLSNSLGFGGHNATLLVKKFS
jgi:3-oxoacyl-[acyl-carrier-protein] synthase II